MDINIYLFRLINSGAGTRPVTDGIAVFFAQYGPFLMAGMFMVMWFALRDKRINLIEAVEASVLGLVINLLIGLFYYHPRPYMLGLCTPLFPHGTETSFPSDHATIMFAAAMYMMRRHSGIWGPALFMLAFATAWGRVYSGVHFPADMAGSFLVAVFSAYAVGRLSGFLLSFNRRIVKMCMTAVGIIPHLKG